VVDYRTNSNNTGVLAFPNLTTLDGWNTMNMILWRLRHRPVARF